jgi:hypothetical protein
MIMDLSLFTKIANIIVECIKEATADTGVADPLIKSFRASGQQSMNLLRLPRPQPQQQSPVNDQPAAAQAAPGPQASMNEEKNKKKQEAGAAAVGDIAGALGGGMGLGGLLGLGGGLAARQNQ